MRAQRCGELSSCVTMTSVVPASRFMLEDQLDDARRPNRASRLPVGSSASSSFGLHDEGARQRDALLLAAGKMLRIVVAGARRVRRARAPRAAAASAPASPAISSGSITFSSAVSAGSSWKDWNTKPTARPRSSARASSSSTPRSGTVELHRPGARRVEAGENREQRRLARARGADDRDRLARA